MCRIFYFFLALFIIVIAGHTAKSEPLGAAAALARSRGLTGDFVGSTRGLNEAQIFEKKLLQKRKQRLNHRGAKKVSRANSRAQKGSSEITSSPRRQGSADKGIPSLASGMFVK